MQIVNPLDAILGTSVKIKVIRFLLKNGLDLSGRQIARHIGVSHPACHRALKELSKL